MTTEHGDDQPDALPLYDRRNYRRAPATLPGHRQGKSPVTKGNFYPSKTLSAEAIAALLEACGDATTSGLRLRALIAVLYRTGMTVTEALNARISELDLQPGQEAIRAAGTKLVERRLALDPYALAYLRPWLEARQVFPGGPVFCVIDGPTVGRDWDYSGVGRELRKLGREVLDRRVNPGSLRLTMAAELIVEQWPLTYMQSQLGLKSVWSFRELFPQLGVFAAPYEDVAEVARTRPVPLLEES